MAKSRKLEELMVALSQIRAEPTSEADLTILQQVLGSPYGVAVAQAAQLVGQFELNSFIPQLVAAFDRFLIKPEDKDPGCRGKQAIAETLYRLEHSDETLFLKGIRHIQKEPIWGGHVDTAPRLRGTCALGLVRMNYPQVMVELADLLADPEPEARIGAARAIAYTQNDQGVPLLRLRVKIGDTSPVLSECLIALLQLAPAQSLPLIKGILYARGELGMEAVDKAEAAALALAESRINDAFVVLRDWWQGTQDPELRKTGLLAISSLRQPEAIDFLLYQIAEGKLKDAKAAIKAMGIHRQDRTLWQRVCQVVQDRQDVALEALLEKAALHHGGLN